MTDQRGVWNAWGRDDSEEQTGEVVFETAKREDADEREAEAEDLSAVEEATDAPDVFTVDEGTCPDHVVPLHTSAEEPVGASACEPSEPKDDAHLYGQYQEPEAPRSFSIPEDDLATAQPVDEVRRLDVRKLAVLGAVAAVLIAAGVAVAASSSDQEHEVKKTEPRTHVPGAEEFDERDREADEMMPADEEPMAQQQDDIQAQRVQAASARPAGYQTPEEREASQRLEAKRAERSKAMGSQIAFRRRTPPPARARRVPEGGGAPPRGLGPAGLTFSGRNEQSQDPKLAFFDDQHSRATQSPHAVQAPGSPYVVMEGSVLDMVLETAIDSQNPGLVKARLVRAVFDTPTGQYLLVPAGTIVIGEYNSQTQPGQTRAQIAWRRMILPGGDSIQIPGAVGIAADGSSGIEGDVDRHLDEVAIAALVSTTLTAGAASVSNTPANQSGPSEWAAQGAGQAVSEVGERLVDEASQIPPTIRIEPGARVMAFVRSDLVFDRPR